MLTCACLKCAFDAFWKGTVKKAAKQRNVHWVWTHHLDNGRHGRDGLRRCCKMEPSCSSRLVRFPLPRVAPRLQQQDIPHFYLTRTTFKVLSDFSALFATKRQKSTFHNRKCFSDRLTESQQNQQKTNALSSFHSTPRLLFCSKMAATVEFVLTWQTNWVAYWISGVTILWTNFGCCVAFVFKELWSLATKNGVSLLGSKTV